MHLPLRADPRCKAVIGSHSLQAVESVTHYLEQRTHDSHFDLTGEEVSGWHVWGCLSLRCQLPQCAGLPPLLLQV